MPDKLKTDLFRIYCARDKTYFPFVSGSTILCANGHELAKNFPHEDFWDYCCDCNVFMPATASGDEAEVTCKICERKITRRFLCDQCKVMTVESDVIEQSRIVTLGETWIPSPCCPGCLKAASDSTVEHDCYSLFVTYRTTRSECPFCTKSIESENQNDKFPSMQPPPAAPRSKYNFTILESFGRSNDWLVRFRSYLPQTRKGWFEFVAVVSVALTALGVILAMFPSVPGAVAWQVRRRMKRPPFVASIECAGYVREGQRLKLRIPAEDPDGDQLRFDWSCSPRGQIDGSGSEVELKTDGIVSGMIPVEISVSVIVRDTYGNNAPRQKTVFVVPYKMANNPPVLKIPPRCNCTNLEVRAGESISFYALAEHEDRDDKLIYDWKCSTLAAQIITENTASGSTAILNTSGMNPQSAAVPLRVSLRVSDGHGGDVVDGITIMVLPKQVTGMKEIAVLASRPNHSPKLEAFGADKNPIESGETVRLWALVSDPDGDSPLFYDWKSSAGELQMRGETATLNTLGINAPQVILRVTVSDGHGGSTSQSMTLTVRSPPTKTSTPSPTPQETPKGDGSMGHLCILVPLYEGEVIDAGLLTTSLSGRVIRHHPRIS